MIKLDPNAKLYFFVNETLINNSATLLCCMKKENQEFSQKYGQVTGKEDKVPIFLKMFGEDLITSKVLERYRSVEFGPDNEVMVDFPQMAVDVNKGYTKFDFLDKYSTILAKPDNHIHNQTTVFMKMLLNALIKNNNLIDNVRIVYKDDTEKSIIEKVFEFGGEAIPHKPTFIDYEKFKHILKYDDYNTIDIFLNDEEDFTGVIDVIKSREDNYNRDTKRALSITMYDRETDEGRERILSKFSNIYFVDVDSIFVYKEKREDII